MGGGALRAVCVVLCILSFTTMAQKPIMIYIIGVGGGRRQEGVGNPVVLVPVRSQVYRVYISRN